MCCQHFICSGVSLSFRVDSDCINNLCNFMHKMAVYMTFMTNHSPYKTDQYKVQGECLTPPPPKRKKTTCLLNAQGSKAQNQDHQNVLRDRS